MEKRKFLTLPGLEFWPVRRPARSQSLYRLRYPGSSASLYILLNLLFISHSTICGLVSQSFNRPQIQYGDSSLKAMMLSRIRQQARMLAMRVRKAPCSSWCVAVSITDHREGFRLLIYGFQRARTGLLLPTSRLRWLPSVTIGLTEYGASRV
jgi:hypothetical protein